jgi:uncharacterized damage-inducible protein DinB
MMHALDRLLTYDHWANREDLSRLRTTEHAPRRCTEILAHIIATEWLWLARLRHEPQKMSVWPAFSLDSCAAQLEPLPDACRDYLATADLDGEIRYTNTRGEAFVSRVSDVLLHVPLHGSYHRGQIAMLIRNGGEEPAYTDYIHCTRQGLI